MLEWASFTLVAVDLSTHFKRLTTALNCYLSQVTFWSPCSDWL